MHRSNPRVVVADDSGFMRRLLSSALEEAGFAVVGLAKDGDEALAVCERVRPDVLTLDLAMPGLDGIGVLRRLREAESPIPVVVVSAFSPAHGARAVDALAEGAFELVAKPPLGEPLETFVTELGQKTRAAALARRSPARVVSAAASSPAAPAPAPAPAVRAPAGASRLVVVACSTGGPKALAELLPRLPERLGAGTLIVQHMPPGFTTSLAERLDRSSKLTVREAASGDTPAANEALIAPGGSHLRLTDGRAARLSDEPAVGGLRPRADLTIGDAARIYGNRLLLVVLTGMGRDGLEGAREVKSHGGRILAEDESTCTVYGMPRAIVEANLADAVLPLHRLPEAIAAEAGRAA
jgi:two-component system chemotaxis response regulator CheB